MSGKSETIKFHKETLIKFRAKKAVKFFNS